MYCLVRLRNFSFPPVDFNYTFRGKLKVTINHMKPLTMLKPDFYILLNKRPYLTPGMAASSIPKILENSLIVM